MLQNEGIGSPQGLSLHAKGVAFQGVFVLGSVRRLVFGDEQPDRVVPLRAEDPGVERGVVNVEACLEVRSAVNAAWLQLLRCEYAG